MEASYSNVTDLENRENVCENGGTDDLRDDDLINLLIRLGEEQECIIALMKDAFERDDNETVLKLAKELVYG
jgi:hypothetical protein